MESNDQDGARYVAFMADVIGSQDVDDPARFQDDFVAAAAQAARRQADASPLAAPLEVTGGDEAKGLYRSFGAAWDTFVALQAAIHPHRLRVGFGAGRLVATPGSDDRVGALNGECLVRARKAIDGADRHLPVRIEPSPLQAVLLAQNALSLALLQRHAWKPRQALYAHAYRDGEAVGAIAERLGVSDGTVSASLSSSLAHTVHNTEGSACVVLDQLLAEGAL